MKRNIMKSINFEFLRETWPELADLGGFAEQYVWPDPSSALVKLRSFVEFIVLRIYREYNLPKPDQPNLFELIKNDAFCGDIPKTVLDKLHAIRINGNKAAHGESYQSKTALWLIKESFDLGRWLYITVGAGTIGACPEFQEPANINGERQVVLKKLASQEAQMQQLLQELEAARSHVAFAEKEAEALQALKASGHKNADELKFDELTTRRCLIDSMLVSAGWDVAPNGGNTEEVTQEEEMKHQPTDTGIGYADYVLWDDNGKPLAVIEAKKTAITKELGREQAKLYADGLEKMHDQRPVIFYTNGFEISIWDDAQDYPPRELFGFYSKKSLQYLVNFQRGHKKDLNSIKINEEITDRLYQTEAINRIKERFTGKHRKALLVQATGTGKTRVAVSLTDVLRRANWAKSVLFMCDRRELRKQAKNAFNTYIDEPLVVITGKTSKEREKRIHLATYPAMSKIFQTFDVGFFDLIIADESHRSIYNRYRDIFQYFDCLQVGLTATPVDKINRNTFTMFGCEEGHPTAYYPLGRAIEEEYLVPYEVYTHTTKFLREGIKYNSLTKEQKEQLEENGDNPEIIDYEQKDIDKQIFNKDTNRAIIRNLMENGIKDAIEQAPGKTIIFARNHNHAILLEKLFNVLYPQYSGKFCKVIDNYDPRAEQLIDDFKDENNELTLAISVDMLDTGIDVPEIVNLVFAKPVYSRVKFDQMIGRGTRLRKDLFGLGKDKSKFRIFDHWGNFDYFDEKPEEADRSRSKPLMQIVFETRIDLAEISLNKSEIEFFSVIVELLQKDLAQLPDNSISVKERWRELKTVSKPETLKQFAPTTVAVLRNEMAPLMQWINIRGHGEAYYFDYLITRMQIELINKTGRFEDLKEDLLNRLSELQMHLNPVREQAETIKKAKSQEFWDTITVQDLEEVRKKLRGIMQFRLKAKIPAVPPKVIDVTDGDIQYAHRPSSLPEVEMRLYKERVEEVLEQLFDKDPTLAKIRVGEPVSEADLNALVSLVLTQNSDVDLKLLKEFFPETAVPLDFAIRSVIGMEPEAVAKRFAEFARKHPSFTAKQTRFLSMLQNHIAKNGYIDLDRLYEQPFTTIDSDGLDGVFENEDTINDLLAVIESFKPQELENQ